MKEGEYMEPQTIHNSVPRAEETDVRIVSWNILSEELTPTAPNIHARISDICKTIRTLDPDAMGVQEISETCYQLFREMLPEYEFTNPKTQAGEFSYTGVAYRADRYRLLDSGIENYEQGNRRIRIVNWIAVEPVRNGKRFLLVSTHWDRHACNRPAQAKYMGHLVAGLSEKFGIPAICTGDFNARENTGIFQNFLAISGQKDAKDLAPEVINRCFSGHPVGSFVPEFDEPFSIDHLTVADGIRVLQYEQVINETVARASDHFPTCADLKFPN